MQVHRRRIVLMRHGAVEYFDAEGVPHPPDDVPLTERGRAQARAAGEALAAGGVAIDRVIHSGLVRTRATTESVLDAGGYAMHAHRVEVWPELQEVRGGRLAAIPDDALHAAFVAPFQGPVPRNTRFLGGETIGELIDRALPALRRLLAANDWDTALLVLHGGVNRALLSWLLTGQETFLGGLSQDPGCINIVDAGDSPATSMLRVMNYCPLDVMLAGPRVSTMEHLLAQYRKLRERGSNIDIE
jgi:probable phosphoglycerate mutase